MSERQYLWFFKELIWIIIYRFIIIFFIYIIFFF